MEMTRTQIVRINRGRLTIPAAFRGQLGIDERALVRLTIERDELRIDPAPETGARQGSPWLRDLYEQSAPVREEILERSLSEVEVNADIDAKIAEVRAEQRGAME
jgi:bifunctional DNA-binding transcriptional regulator/antitoxin component of YhaV-PrlF toxin-antitoxin module